MDDGLTFRFVFTDEGQQAAPAHAPPDAQSGAAARLKPSATEEAPPAPRKLAAPRETAPTPKSETARGETVPEQPAKESPFDRNEDRRPRRVPRQAEAGEAAAPAPRKAAEQGRDDRKPGEAAKLLAELVRHLQQVPGIGRAIGGLYHVVEPLVDAGRRIQKLRADVRKEERPTPEPRPVESNQEAATTPSTPATEKGDAPAKALPAPVEREAPEPRPVPAPMVNVEVPEPRTVERPIESNASPAELQPAPPRSAPEPDYRPMMEREPPAPREPGEFRIAPEPSSSAALEKLIAALGPLPENTRELKEALQPLTDLGYSMKELLAAVKSLERSQEERAPGIEGARPAEPAPEKRPTFGASKEDDEALERFERRKKRPFDLRPLPDTPAPRPPVVAATPVPTPSAAASATAAEAPASGAAAATAESAAAGSELSGAAAGAAAGAALGPAGLIAGVAIVAAVGTATRAISGLAKAAQNADRALQDTAQRLAPFSGALSAAQANASVRQLMNDIQRAQRMGPELARFTDERSQLDINATAIGDAVKGAIMEDLIPAIKLLNNFLEPLAKNPEELKQNIHMLTRIVFPVLNLWDLAKKWFNLEQDAKLSADLPWSADVFGIFGNMGDVGQGFTPEFSPGPQPFGPFNNPKLPDPFGPGVSLDREW